MKSGTNGFLCGTAAVVLTLGACSPKDRNAADSAADTTANRVGAAVDTAASRMGAAADTAARRMDSAAGSVAVVRQAAITSAVVRIRHLLE